MATCSHPQAAKRVRYIIVKGHRVRNELCRECRNAYWRNERALRRAFRLIATMPVPA